MTDGVSGVSGANNDVGTTEANMGRSGLNADDSPGWYRIPDPGPLRVRLGEFRSDPPPTAGRLP